MLDTPASRKQPAQTDILVGQRIRMRRNMLKVSQEKLAEAIGVSFQQVQKYEKGTNRIGASRLQQIADALNVSPTVFFEGTGSAQSDTETRELMEMLQHHDVLALVRAFVAIRSAEGRTKILGLIKFVAAQSAD